MEVIMLEQKKLYERQISDNEFQKVSWKKNKVQIQQLIVDMQSLVNWILENTEGRWHYKEASVNIRAGQPIPVNTKNPQMIYSYQYKTIFWFELESDASLFKLYWF